MTDTLTSSDILAALIDLGVAGPGENARVQTLAGGVSCDVFVVHFADRSLCVKRALAKLRVAADWRAPAERSEAEVAWLRLAATLNPKWVPAVLGDDRARHLFVMEFFPPEKYPVWKSLLAAGTVDIPFAGQVGAALGTIHANTAGRADIAAEFANDQQFYALRIEPYLLHSAANNPDIAPIVEWLADNVAVARIALMHGDVSPKNILRGPDGPVFLDAETTCYGDPAFDLAFCLNHLLLKCVWHPEHADAYLASFAALRNAYFTIAQWEDGRGLDARTAKLLSALLLARIDGKSPVEYLTDARDKDFVRAQAKAFLTGPDLTLDALSDRWRAALKSRR